MAFDKVIDSALLDAGMAATANAIREKTGSASPIAWDSANGFKAAVEGIATEGGVELPELDNPATEAEVFLGKEYINGNGQKKTGSFTIDDELTEQDSLISQITTALRNKAANGSIALPELTNPAAASDLAYDKQLIDADGNVVTGTLGEATEGMKVMAPFNEMIGTPGDTVFNITATCLQNYIGDNTKGTILRPGALLTPRNIPTNLFGDAAAADVVKGKTFTSAAGLLVEGTHECEGGVTLPELGDTAAQPTDIAFGKVLYDDDGNPVTGTLNDFLPGAEGRYIFGTNPRVSGNTSLFVEAESSSTASPIIHRPGSTATVRIPSAAFGTAAAHQVAKGATFTSAAGLLVEGTHECDAGMELAPLDNPATAADLVSGKSLYDQNGNLVTGTLYEALAGKVIAAQEFQSVGETGSSGLFVLAKQTVGDVVARNGTLFRSYAPTSAFGTATGAYVAKGKTFTSEAGLLAEGELEEIAAGRVMSAKEDVIVRRNSDGTIQIVAKTNFDLAGAIVRSGAYLRITAPASAFDGILGSADDVTIDGETLVFGANSTATIENDTLIL